MSDLSLITLGLGVWGIGVSVWLSLLVLSLFNVGEDKFPNTDLGFNLIMTSPLVMLLGFVLIIWGG